MRLLPLTLSRRSRFIWLLWLVFLLPIAQNAANLHVLSHALADRFDASLDTAGKNAAQPAHCDICLTAAALAGAAPPMALPVLPRLQTPHQRPHAIAHAVRSTRTIAAYQSRAPPFSLR